VGLPKTRRIVVTPMQWIALRGTAGKLTRIERVLQRVLQSFYAAGGNERRLLQLRVTTWLFGNSGPGMSELTSDLLTDALSLVHPDRHPPERQELAKRVTARLSDLRPFVPEPEPSQRQNLSQSLPTTSCGRISTSLLRAWRERTNIPASIVSAMHR